MIEYAVMKLILSFNYRSSYPAASYAESEKDLLSSHEVEVSGSSNIHILRADLFVKDKPKIFSKYEAVIKSGKPLHAFIIRKRCKHWTRALYYLMSLVLSKGHLGQQGN